MSTSNFDAVRLILDVRVSDELLTLALSHPSAVGEGLERTLKSNQRLEFLGDAVLGACVASHLYREKSTLSEGELTLRKIALVQKPTLARAAKELKLGRYLILGRGEDAAGGRRRDAILADVLEALIGAVYLEHGFEAAQKFVRRALQTEIEKLETNSAVANVKNLLQEKTQAIGLGTPTYQTQGDDAPSNARTFTARVLLQGEIYGHGQGASKKDAECEAAQQALDKLSALHGSGN